MKAALRDYVLLGRAALATRHRLTHAILWGSSLFMALCMGGGTWLVTRDAGEVLLNVIRTLYGIFVFVWTLYLIPGLIKLNTPTNAKLVPRMRRRAIELMVLVWTAVTVLSTLLTLGSPVSPQLVFFYVGAWLIAFGLGQGGHRFGVEIQFLAVAAIFGGVQMPRAWLEVLAGAPVFAVGLLLMLAAGAYTIEVMFANGGDRHFRLRSTQQVVAEQATTKGMTKHARVSRMGRWAYQGALMRDCVRRDAGTLLMHLLGPAIYGPQRWLSLLGFAATVGIALVVVRGFASADLLKAIGDGTWTFVCSALLVQVFSYLRRQTRLSLTRSEQGLLKLATLMPGAAVDFNRLLARGLLREALVEWALVCAIVVGLVALSGAPFAILWRVACACFLALPLCTWQLRDQARSSRNDGWRVARMYALSMGLCFGLAVLAERLLGTPVLPVAALAAVVWTAVAVPWGWRRAVDAPHAFPVERLA